MSPARTPATNTPQSPVTQLFMSAAALASVTAVLLYHMTLAQQAPVSHRDMVNHV